MKKVLYTSIVVVGFLSVMTAAYAASDQTKQTTVSATVESVFSLEFYTEPGKVLYSTSVPFSSVDPTNDFNYADGRAAKDGKSDVGLLVKSNSGNTWYLKVGINAASPLLGKLAYYMGQPTNRNWDSPADGSLGHADWFNVPAKSNSEVMYTAGTADKINTPLGTLATMSFKIDGSGLTAGAQAATATYTLTETP